jgi:hypothetical protein
MRYQDMRYQDMRYQVETEPMRVFGLIAPTYLVISIRYSESGDEYRIEIQDS